MKILFVTGSRGEWGYIRPLLRIIDQSDDMSYCLVVTNMHLVAAYGNSAEEIEREGFHIDYKVNMCLDGYNHYTMVKSLGVFMMSFPDIVEKEKPSWIVLAGDRGEQMIAAMVGAHTYTPVAHIQAGELSGNIDGMTRHAIGKYAHLHLAANNDAASRLIKLGEEEFRVHNVGAPQLDELVASCYTSLQELEALCNTDLTQGFFLMVMHPVTEEYEKAQQQAETLVHAMNRFSQPKIVIMPNNDAGSYGIRYALQNCKEGKYYIFANLKREDYLGFMKNCLCMVGNSSSGLLEAPTFKKAAVNIGRRQNHRYQGVNVINVPEFEEEKIVEAVEKAMSKEFVAFLNKNCENPYGDGHSSERIIELLRKTPINERLLVKSLTY